MYSILEVGSSPVTIEKPDLRVILGYWWTALVFVQLILFFASSRAECGSVALAKTPLHHLGAIWTFIAVVVSAACWTEWVMWFKFQPQNQDSDRPWYKPFTCWFLMSMTIVNITDICTDSLTVGVMVATHSCASSGIPDVWRQVVEQSWLPCFIPLWSLALVAWLTTAGQFAVALVVGYRNTSQSAIAEAADLLGFEIVLQCIECPSGALVNDHDVAGPGDVESKCPSGALVNDHNAEGPRDVASKLNAADMRVTKFILRTLFENCLQLHVQITTVALSVALTGWQQGSILMMIFAASALCSMACALADVPQMMADANEAGSHWTKVVIWTSVFAAVFFFAYAVAKFWAVFYCEFAAMNLSGCVVLKF